MEKEPEKVTNVSSVPPAAWGETRREDIVEVIRKFASKALNGHESDVEKFAEALAVRLMPYCTADYQADLFLLSKGDHSPAPWVASSWAQESTYPYVMESRGKRAIVGCGDVETRSEAEGMANMRRVVACVNVCEGISSAVLENCSLGKAVDWLREYHKNSPDTIIGEKMSDT